MSREPPLLTRRQDLEQILELNRYITIKTSRLPKEEREEEKIRIATEQLSGGLADWYIETYIENDLKPLYEELLKALAIFCMGTYYKGKAFRNISTTEQGERSVLEYNRELSLYLGYFRIIGFKYETTGSYLININSALIPYLMARVNVDDTPLPVLMRLAEEVEIELGGPERLYGMGSRGSGSKWLHESNSRR